MGFGWFDEVVEVLEVVGVGVDLGVWGGEVLELDGVIGWLVVYVVEVLDVEDFEVWGGDVVYWGVLVMVEERMVEGMNRLCWYFCCWLGS